MSPTCCRVDQDHIWEKTECLALEARIVGLRFGMPNKTPVTAVCFPIIDELRHLKNMDAHLSHLPPFQEGQLPSSRHSAVVII